MRLGFLIVAMPLAVALAGCRSDDALAAAVVDDSPAEETSKVASAVAVREAAKVLYFTAPWCGPCRVQGPIMEAIAEEYAGRVEVVKVNVDERPDLASRHGVRSIPTMVVFRGDEARSVLTGLQEAPRLRAELDGVLGDD